MPTAPASTSNPSSILSPPESRREGISNAQSLLGCLRGAILARSARRPGLPRLLKSYSYRLIPIPGSGVFCFRQIPSLEMRLGTNGAWLRRKSPGLRHLQISTPSPGREASSQARPPHLGCAPDGPGSCQYYHHQDRTGLIELLLSQYVLVVARRWLPHGLSEQRPPARLRERPGLGGGAGQRGPEEASERRLPRPGPTCAASLGAGAPGCGR